MRILANYKKILNRLLEVLEEMYAEVINPQLPVDDPAAAIASLTS